MPLIRIDMFRGKPAAYRTAVCDIVPENFGRCGRSQMSPSAPRPCLCTKRQKDRVTDRAATRVRPVNAASAGAAVAEFALIHQRGEANRLRGTVSARRRVSSSASARIQIERPRLAMSFIRNSPFDDNTGNPPADASPTPGVVHMKLTVPAKKMTASRPPAMDALGNHGLAATNAAVISSIIPSTLPNVSMDMMR
jgi:hypothetical protein